MSDDRNDKLKPSPDEEAPKATEEKLGDMGKGSFEETHSGQDPDDEHGAAKPAAEPKPAAAP